MTTIFSEDILLNLRRRALIHAKKLGFNEEESEEIAQEYVLRVLTGKHSNSTVWQAVIDIVRSFFGRPTHVNYQNRKIIYAGYILETIDTGMTEEELNEAVKNLSKNLSVKEKFIFKMLSQGYTQKEIASLFSISETRLSQVVKQIKFKILDYKKEEEEQIFKDEKMIDSDVIRKNVVKFLSRGLSLRQIEVIGEVVEGKTNKEIGEKLFISEKTVKFHLTYIFKRLKIRSRTQLLRKAFEICEQPLIDKQTINAA